MTLEKIQDLKKIGEKSKQASLQLKTSCTKQKNIALKAIANKIDFYSNKIINTNKIDLNNGEKNKLDSALLNRLKVDKKGIDLMITSLLDIIKLPDPIGEITDMKYRPSGIQVGKMRVPLGVVGIIYESRPNVTIDASALCIKSGNTVILRGGKEAINTNIILHQCVQEGLKEAKLDSNCAQIIKTTDRKVIGELVKLSGLVDMIIPRGGKGLIEYVSKKAVVPVIKHLHGICHIYIHKQADIKKAIDIAFNAKVQRPGVCNAMETLLVDKDIANKVLPKLAEKLFNSDVEIRGCAKTKKIIPKIKLATTEDWHTEYLSLILSIKLVDNIAGAIDHIEKYGSAHTESIITENYNIAREFLSAVDSSSVMVNASTRFADGAEYGLGAEIGISTDKFHVRGPVGLEALTSQKFVVLGDGNIRT